MKADDELEIPVAYCSKCEDTGPVVIHKIEHGEWLAPEVIYDGAELLVIYCPGCMTILNTDGDIEIKWYSLEDLPKVTGWKLSDDMAAKLAKGGIVDSNTAYSIGES